MTCTHPDARELAGMLRAHEDNLGAVLHQIRIQLTAIAPYGDRRLSRLADVLVWLLTRPAEVQARAIAKMHDLAKTGASA